MQRLLIKAVVLLAVFGVGRALQAGPVPIILGMLAASVLVNILYFKLRGEPQARQGSDGE